jgi:hypothetical protein
MRSGFLARPVLVLIITRPLRHDFRVLISIMSNRLFTITAPGTPNRQPQLLGKFYTSDPAPLSTAEKNLICQHLGITFRTFEDGLLFEPTAWACDDALIGRSPDYTLIDGRRLWIYRPDEPLPV